MNIVESKVMQNFIDLVKNQLQLNWRMFSVESSEVDVGAVEVGSSWQLRQRCLLLEEIEQFFMWHQFLQEKQRIE